MVKHKLPAEGGLTGLCVRKIANHLAEGGKFPQTHIPIKFHSELLKLLADQDRRLTSEQIETIKSTFYHQSHITKYNFKMLVTEFSCLPDAQIITHLDLSDQYCIKKPTLQSLVKQLHSVRELKLDWLNEQVNNQTLELIGQHCNRLEKLNLIGTSISSIGMYRFISIKVQLSARGHYQMERLTHLNISHCSFEALRYNPRNLPVKVHWRLLQKFPNLQSFCSLSILVAMVKLATLYKELGHDLDQLPQFKLQIIGECPYKWHNLDSSLVPYITTMFPELNEFTLNGIFPVSLTYELVKLRKIFIDNENDYWRQGDVDYDIPDPNPINVSYFFSSKTAQNLTKLHLSHLIKFCLLDIVCKCPELTEAVLHCEHVCSNYGERLVYRDMINKNRLPLLNKLKTLTLISYSSTDAFDLQSLEAFYNSSPNLRGIHLEFGSSVACDTFVRCIVENSCCKVLGDISMMDCPVSANFLLQIIKQQLLPELTHVSFMGSDKQFFQSLDGYNLEKLLPALAKKNNLNCKFAIELWDSEYHEDQPDLFLENDDVILSEEMLLNIGVKPKQISVKNFDLFSLSSDDAIVSDDIMLSIGEPFGHNKVMFNEEMLLNIGSVGLGDISFNEDMLLAIGL